MRNSPPMLRLMAQPTLFVRDEDGRYRPYVPATLHSSLRFAHAQFVLELPELQHSVSLTDDGGAPAMKPAAASYLGLLAKRLLEDDKQPDNWKARAARRDPDGRYLTPLRLAIELAPEGERAFLRSLVPELYFPSEIAELHGIPRWAAKYVMYAALARLRERYETLIRNSEKGSAANVGWVSMSESARRAIEAGERVA